MIDLPPSPPPIERAVIVHGFRAPLTGLEVKEGPLGLAVGIYPTVIDNDEAGQPRGSLFLKTGLMAYWPGTGFYGGLSLLQPLTPGWVPAGFLELGYRWTLWNGLELRLGAGGLLAADGRFRLNPTPGIGWAIPF